MLVLAKLFLRILIILVVLAFVFSFIFNRWIQPNSTIDAESIADSGEFISVGEQEIHFIDQGVGPKTYVLLHDYGFSSYTWRHVIPELSRSGRVIAIDMAGFGYSSKGELDYSTEARVARLKNFLQLLNVDSTFTLVGHGLGGKVALVYTAAHGNDVDELILIAPQAYEKNSYPGFFFSTPEISLAAYKIFNSDMRLESTYRGMFVDESVLSVDDVEAFLEPYHTQGSESGYLQMLKLKESRPDYSLVIRPTLILYGEQDMIVDRVDMERLRADLFNARVTTIPGAGHAVHEELPDELLGHLGAFLADPTRNNTR